MEVLWPMDRAVDGGEGQPGPELGPAREVLAVFSKPATYPGFADPPKTADRNFVDVAASQQRLRVEERNSAVD